MMMVVVVVVVVLRLLLPMAEREMHRLLQFLLSMQMHRLLPFFFMSVAAKLAEEEDGRRLRKNDGGVGNAGDGGGGGRCFKAEGAEMVAGGEGSFLLCAEAEASFFVFFLSLFPSPKMPTPKSCRYFPPPP